MDYLEGHKIYQNMPSNMKKICTKCQLEQDIELFVKCSANKDGHYSWCKKCQSKINRKYWRSKDEQKKHYITVSNNPDPKKALEFSIQNLVSHAKSRSKTRNLPYDITYDYLMELYYQQAGRCYYTNTPMKLKGIGRINRDLLIISIDRILPKNGYVKGNVVLCCLGINLLKHSHTPNVLMETLQIFYENIKVSGKLVDMREIESRSPKSSMINTTRLVCI